MQKLFRPTFVITNIIFFIVGITLGYYGMSSPLMAQKQEGQSSGGMIQTIGSDEKSEQETNNLQGNNGKRIFSINQSPDDENDQQNNNKSELKKRLKKVRNAKKNEDKIDAMEELLAELVIKRQSTKRGMKVIRDGLKTVLEGQKVILGADEGSDNTRKVPDETQQSRNKGQFPPNDFNK